MKMYNQIIEAFNEIIEEGFEGIKKNNARLIYSILLLFIVLDIILYYVK